MVFELGLKFVWFNKQVQRFFMLSSFVHDEFCFSFVVFLLVNAGLYQQCGRCVLKFYLFTGITLLYFVDCMVCD